MCVEVSFPTFFELTERPGCQCKCFPSSTLFAHSPFSLAHVIDYSFSFLSFSFIINLPFTVNLRHV